jgi:hypothetical protein
MGVFQITLGFGGFDARSGLYRLADGVLHDRTRCGMHKSHDAC